MVVATGQKRMKIGCVGKWVEEVSGRATAVLL